MRAEHERQLEDVARADEAAVQRARPVEAIHVRGGLCGLLLGQFDGGVAERQV